MVEATVCAICGQPPTPDDPLTRGHKVARSNGGKNVPANYQAEHRSCGGAKGNRD
jgi:5-methylcytosine-specific restriction endonuclease McrA